MPTTEWIRWVYICNGMLLLLLLSHFSPVRLCATPQTAVHHTPPSLGFSRQEYWSGLPFPSPMHESEKWKWSCSVMSDSSRPHGRQPTRLLRPWDFPGKSTGVGCHCLLCQRTDWFQIFPLIAFNYCLTHLISSSCSATPSSFRNTSLLVFCNIQTDFLQKSEQKIEARFKSSSLFFRTKHSTLNLLVSY